MISLGSLVDKMSLINDNSEPPDNPVDKMSINNDNSSPLKVTTDQEEVFNIVNYCVQT